MKIIIEGAGQVGAHLAKMLSAEDNDITVLDEDAARIRQLALQADVITLQGPSASIGLLREAGEQVAVAIYRSLDQTTKDRIRKGL